MDPGTIKLALEGAELAKFFISLALREARNAGLSNEETKLLLMTEYATLIGSDPGEVVIPE